MPASSPHLAVGNGSVPAKATHDFTISELVFKYMTHAENYYVDPTTNAPTSELAAIMEASRPLRRLFGPVPVNDFDSVCLEAIQQAMATGSTWTAEEREKKTRHNRPIGMARTTINRHIDRIKRIMRWGCAKKIVPADNLVNIESVASLKAGRTNSRETKIVKPVDPAIVDLTLAHMPPTPADMVRLMLLSGCRVGELCRLKGCELGQLKSSAPGS